jgi:hypothetical protein
MSDEKAASTGNVVGAVTDLVKARGRCQSFHEQLVLTIAEN